MKSLEELEKAYERGLQAPEEGLLVRGAKKIGQKVIREIKRVTPVDTGNLRRRWASSVTGSAHDINILLSNDTEYAPYVNYGHRVVRGGKTVGTAQGHMMLEKGIETYKNTYLQEDMENIAKEFGKVMKG